MYFRDAFGDTKGKTVKITLFSVEEWLDFQGKNGLIAVTM